MSLKKFKLPSLADKHNVEEPKMGKAKVEKKPRKRRKLKADKRAVKPKKIKIKVKKRR